MREFLLSYGLFLAKVVTLVTAAGVLLALLAAAGRTLRQASGERLEIRHLNERLRELAETLNRALLDAPARRREQRRFKRERKARHARASGAAARVFVLDFRGDLQASCVAALREEISALLQVAQPRRDEVLLRLESAGGTIPAYGLAASQLQRIRDRGLKLTAAIDKIAASGGYLMACAAERILAAPFAIVGSIGVVGQLPNFNRWLREHHIDFELHTAGEYKRTLTLFGENTEAARAKFREELEQAHGLFKDFVAARRPALELSRVATGEYWYGAQALALKLVDELTTSDDYLLKRAQEAEVYEVRFRRRRSLREQLIGSLAQLRTNRLPLPPAS
jgi:serine protease SohB